MGVCLDCLWIWGIVGSCWSDQFLMWRTWTCGLARHLLIWRTPPRWWIPWKPLRLEDPNLSSSGGLCTCFNLNWLCNVETGKGKNIWLTDFYGILFYLQNKMIANEKWLNLIKDINRNHWLNDYWNVLKFLSLILLHFTLLFSIDNSIFSFLINIKIKPPLMYYDFSCFVYTLLMKNEILKKQEQNYSVWW